MPDMATGVPKYSALGKSETVKAGGYFFTRQELVGFFRTIRLPKEVMNPDSKYGKHIITTLDALEMIDRVE